MGEALSQEDVFTNDVDPLDGIRALRKEEGMPETDLPPATEDSTDSAPSPDDDDDSELESFTDENSESTTQTDSSSKKELEPEPADNKGEAQNGDTEEKMQEPDSAEESSDKEVKELKPEVTDETYKFKAHGQDFEFTQKEIMEQFSTVFGQAMDYTKKMQSIAPYRKMISAIEQEGISQDQLNLAIDALKGNKEALQQILKTNDIDTYDLDAQEDSSSYAPTPYGKDESQLQIEEVVSTIRTDPEYQITVDVVDNQWDMASRQNFAKNPQLIVGLHNDIKTGLYDQVAPRAMKMKVLDRNQRSDIEYYMLAGEQVRLEKEGNAQSSIDKTNKQTQDAVDNADQASSEAQRKRSASSTRTRADRNRVIDYLDDDDETFDAWYKNVQANN